MPIQILMPALSPTMTEGTIAKWAKKEGDAVESGDVLAEIESDKATMEIEAVDEGTLGKILVPEGTEEVPVNQVIALLLEDRFTRAFSASASASDSAARSRSGAWILTSLSAPLRGGIHFRHRVTPDDATMHSM